MSTCTYILQIEFNHGLLWMVGYLTFLVTLMLVLKKLGRLHIWPVTILGYQSNNTPKRLAPDPNVNYYSYPPSLLFVMHRSPSRWTNQWSYNKQFPWGARLSWRCCYQCSHTNGASSHLRTRKSCCYYNVKCFKLTGCDNKQ